MPRRREGREGVLFNPETQRDDADRFPKQRTSKLRHHPPRVGDLSQTPYCRMMRVVSDGTTTETFVVGPSKVSGRPIGMVSS